MGGSPESHVTRPARHPARAIPLLRHANHGDYRPSVAMMLTFELGRPLSEARKGYLRWALKSMSRTMPDVDENSYLVSLYK